VERSESLFGTSFAPILRCCGLSNLDFSGGGITGAALANLLLKHPDKIEVQVYEAAKHFDEIGAGIGLWGRALEVFKPAGLYEEVLKVAIRPDSKDPGMLSYIVLVLGLP
jgi:hypothetical protein